MSTERLQEYRAKRDFKRTPEPAGRRRRTKGAPAVAKGPSLNPSDKRLAMRTEDHPLEYADFEGVIPEGEYGAGPVIVWDSGTYENRTEKDGKPVPVEDAVRRGHLNISLEGRKLAGGFSLMRMAKGKRERWLLVKRADEKADRRRNIVRSAPKSVLSGRTVKQLAKKSGSDPDSSKR
jgi:DNA ligase D-like protein (predicted 3'-phosphoesterase)